MSSRKLLSAAVAVALYCTSITAQTFSSCNPLYSTGCPANTALGRSINIDFTKGEANSFTSIGNPTYDSEGVHFSVGAPGAAPQLISGFFIMFGKVEISMKAAPGAGIVSSLVLQSDTLDEIDIEWLGAADNEMQSNYFGKGDVTSYNRGAFHANPNNQAAFHTYTIDWTPKQITWSLDGTVVRVLTPQTADANQYPQTPSQVKFGAWSGGDSNNPPGTIQWAKGPTDYSKGPFVMTVRSIAITDYSTGSQYTYSGNSGNQDSIVAVGGAVMGNANDAGQPIATADIPQVTAVSPSVPVGGGLGADNGNTATRTGWPWVATTLATQATTQTTVPGLPSGWIINGEGKVVPATSAAPLPTTNIPEPSSPPSLPGGSNGVETITGWDDRGFPTTRLVTQGWETRAKSFDQQGFEVTAQAAKPTPVAAAAAATVPTDDSINANPLRLHATSVSGATAARESANWQKRGLIVGLAAVIGQRLLV